MPRVLHVVHDFGDNSVTGIVCNIVQHRQSQRIEFHVGAVTSNDARSVDLREVGAETAEFFQGNSISKAIRNYVCEHNIDLVHSHSPRTAVLTYLALRPLRHIPHIQTRHLLTTPGSRRFGIIYTVVDRISLLMSDFVIPVSRTMGDQIRTLPGIKSQRVRPIQNGVDTLRFHVPEHRDATRNELGIGREEAVLIFIGRIEVMKRIDVLLSAFAELCPDFPQARLLIAGNGSLMQKLVLMTDNLGIANHVSWLGFRRDVPKLLAASDIYVQPSSNEGLSLSILEAMAAGNTIVSTDVGAAREMLEHGTSGLIVPPNDTSALSSALRAVLSDKAKAATLAQAARERVINSFSIEKMADAYHHLYQDVLHEQRK